MLRSLLTLISVCLVALGSDAHASDTVTAPPKHVAVIIGVDHYDHLTGLNSAVQDARWITTWLQKLPGDPFKNNVHVLLSERQPGARREATRDHVKRRADEIIDSLDAGDTLFFYFAGHGIEFKGRNFLQVADSRGIIDPKTHAVDIRAATETAIDFKAILERLAARQQRAGITGIFIIDACRSNPLVYAPEVTDSLGVGLSSEDWPMTDVFVLYSAGIGQLALDIDSVGGVDSRSWDLVNYSVFTTVLINELERLPLAAAKPMSIQELMLRVRSAVVRRADAHQGHIQIPAAYDQLKEPRTLFGSLVPGEPQRLSPNADEVLVLTRPLQDGDTLLECAACPEVQVLPFRQESFNIGETVKTLQQPHEAPTSVKLDRRFAIGRFEVTNLEWDFCVLQKGCQGLRIDPLKPETARLPVTDVTYDEARGYAAWLSTWLQERVNAQLKRSGESGAAVKITYRLPTEAEWEFAARGGRLEGDRKAYIYGADAHTGELCRYANGADRSIGVLPDSYQFCNDGIGRGTAPVGKFRAISRAFALHDMIGNAWEWTAQCWSDTPGKGEAASTTPCSDVVARGGSWRSDFPALRTASRNHFNRGLARPTVGFRVVRDVH